MFRFVDVCGARVRRRTAGSAGLLHRPQGRKPRRAPGRSGALRRSGELASCSRRRRRSAARIYRPRTCCAWPGSHLARPCEWRHTEARPGGVWRAPVIFG